MAFQCFGREKLADADPPTEELERRLRSWDAAMTQIKTDGLLAELPTKRLLMQYVQGFVNRADPPGNLQVWAVAVSKTIAITHQYPYPSAHACFIADPFPQSGHICNTSSDIRGRQLVPSKHDSMVALRTLLCLPEIRHCLEQAFSSENNDRWTQPSVIIF